MGYPSGASGNQGYYGADHNGYGSGYGGYPSSRRASDLPRYLGMAVAALGVVSYGLSFGPVHNGGGVLDWGARFALLAALLAGLSLVPGQTPNNKAVAVLAVFGFLDALAGLINASDSGWALTVIVVVNGLQAAAAVVALLQETDASERGTRSEYDAYADYYAQAAQYYGQYGQQPAQPEEARRAGTGQAHAGAHAGARSQQAGTSQAGTYADYVGGAEQAAAGRPVAQPGPQAPAHTGQQAGLPNVGHAQAHAQAPQYGAPQADRPEHRPSS